MAQKATTESAALVADLNDLLQLDRDAVQAYMLAEQGLRNEAFKDTIRRFRGDHERHVEELTRLVSMHGGSAASVPHASSSPFKLAAQGLGNLGSDTAVLLAFKANERLSRDKYQRAANQGYPAEVHAVLLRGAEDESTHYDWVQHTLEQLGAGESTVAGKAEAVVEAGHARLADAMEAGEKQVMKGASAVREKASDAWTDVSQRANRLGEQLADGGMRNVWIAVGVGLVASQLVRRSRSSRGSSADDTATPTTPRAGSRPTTSPRGGLLFSRTETDTSPVDGNGATASRDWGEPAL